jgi:lipoprotein
MMKKIILLFPLLTLTGCLVLDLMPSYSSYFDEDIWVHRRTKEALSEEIYKKCFSQSLKGFEVINEYGFSTVKGEREKIESNRIYASCLRQNGFLFNASYKYCYKFPSVCQKYNEYR